MAKTHQTTKDFSPFQSLILIYQQNDYRISTHQRIHRKSPHTYINRDQWT